MNRARRRACAVVLAAFLAASPALTSAQRDRNLYEPGRTDMASFLEGRFDRIGTRLAVPVPMSTLAPLLQQVLDLAGSETAVLEERVFLLTPVTVYARRSTFTRLAAPGLTEWAYDSQGRIRALRFDTEHPAPAPFAGYETRTPLVLPVRGEWQITGGGDTQIENHHVVTRDQRFAYDMVGVGRNGIYTGDGSRNEDAAGFDQPVFSPADGTVVEAVDGVPENPPGSIIPGHLAGNRIVIDHGNGEYSMLAHFRQGSIRVRTGDRVSSGQEIGRCGNTGNSSGPHLHYHLQNTPLWLAGDGLPAAFLDYVADGVPVARGRPIRGQIIAPRGTSGDSELQGKDRVSAEPPSPRSIQRP